MQFSCVFVPILLIILSRQHISFISAALNNLALSQRLYSRTIRAHYQQIFVNIQLNLQITGGTHTQTIFIYIYIYIYVYIYILYVCVLVGLRILHSYLIESSCTQYEKIDKLKCKLQAQKDYYQQWALHAAQSTCNISTLYFRFCWNPVGNEKQRKKEIV